MENMEAPIVYMRKKWKCTAEVNMCAEHIVTVVVTTNTVNKARALAEVTLLKNYFYVKILKVEELS